MAVVGAGVVALVLAEAAGAAADRYTSLNRWFETLITTHATPRSAPSPSAQLNRVCIVTFSDSTDFNALATEAGVNEFDPKNPKSVRAVHGEFMKRLVGSRAAAVAFDVTFADDEKLATHDGAFVAGVEALRREGIAVVTGVKAWSLSQGGLPKGASRAITSATLWGNTTAGLTADAPWHVLAVLQRGDDAPLPSFALATASAYLNRGHQTTYQLDSGLEQVRLVPVPKHGTGRDLGANSPTASIIKLTTVQLETSDRLESDVLAGDKAGVYVIQMPSAPVLERSRLAYEDIWHADPQTLRRLFENKILLVGDGRSEGDPINEYPDGRSFRGFDAQAVAIDSMLSHSVIKRPGLVKLGGFYLYGQYALDVIGVLIGVLIGLLVRRGTLRRTLFLVLGIGVIAGISFVSYREAAYLLFPAVAMLALVLAAELAAAALHLQPNRIG
jgi:hypothetical protein